MLNLLHITLAVVEFYEILSDIPLVVLCDGFCFVCLCFDKRLENQFDLLDVVVL